MKNKIPMRNVIAFLCIFSSYTAIAADDYLNKAPQASASEAAIKHWRDPELNLRFMDIPELEKAYVTTAPGNQNDQIPVAKLDANNTAKSKILDLVKDIVQDKHGKLDSLLIAHEGKLVFESYFRRGRIDLSHPQSSTTKSYTSLALGRAIQMGYLSMDDLHKPVISFLKDLKPSKLVAGADKVTLHHALTMTTGVKITEEQREQIDAAPEKQKGQQEIQILLESSAPITAESQQFKYGMGPQMIMQVLHAVVPGSAQHFIKKELLDKLGIHNYDWKTAASGLPESGWKASFTSRDMLKFGLLAQNNGKWQGEQLISPAYLKRATSRVVDTGDDDIVGGGTDVSNQGYGYYFWGTDLHYNGKQYPSASAQGGGGMYIQLIEDLDLVVVVTAHHRDYNTQQMIAEHIIPAFAE